jgi:hypothetical protein
MGASVSAPLKPIHDAMYFVLPLTFWAYVLYKSYEFTCVKRNSGISTILLLAVIIFASLDVVYCIGLVTDTAVTNSASFEYLKFNIYAEIVIGTLGVSLATLDLFKTLNNTKCAQISAAYSKASAAYSKARGR